MCDIADLRLIDITDLAAFLTAKAPADSPFKKEKQSQLLYGIDDASNRYKLNKVYILAHAILESGWGRSKIAREKNNLFGFRAYDSDPYGNAMSFKSYIDCINVVMKHVYDNYLTPGGKYYNGATLGGMNKKYASDKEWSNKIRKLINDIYKFCSERKR
jgi:beta-N-acetylglucosaminidase